MTKKTIHFQEKKNSKDPEFASATQDVTPLSCKGRRVIPPVQQATNLSYKKTASPHNNIYNFIINKNSEYIIGYIDGFNIQSLDQIQKGQVRPQAKIDLHGLNIQQAFKAVINFFHTAYLNNYQVVLLITGKGKNSPQGISILKEKLQKWFTQEPLQKVILAFCTAHTNDGGSGALYILLRKYKKTRIIYWDRKSLDYEEL